MQCLEQMQAGPSAGRNGERRRARRRDRRYPPRKIVVVEQRPAALERPPADALDFNRDRRPHRATRRGQGHRHVDGEARLNKEPLALLQNDVMKETKILGHGEGRGDLARRVGPDRGDLEGNRLVFTSVIFRLCHLPSAPDRAPDELELGVGRQSFRRDPHRRTGRAMLGRYRHMPEKAVRRRERRLGAELRGCGSRRQQCGDAKGPAYRGAKPPDHRALTWGVRKCRRSRSAVTV